MTNETYSFLLDFIPLMEMLKPENTLFHDVMTREALNLLDNTCNIVKLRNLIELCKDLGYVDGEITTYLLNHPAVKQ